MSEEKNIPPENFKEQVTNLSAHTQDTQKGENKNISQPEPQSQTSSPLTGQANTEPQTTNMEVHKHPHHVTHKKKWGEYFLEFLMVFLAVFLGFIAENMREHAVEHEREKQYARQMLADLHADSAFFARRIAIINEILKKHQAFYTLMTSSVKPSDKEILNACLPLLYTFEMLVTTGTYNQMKASGGLRYIKNEDLTNAMQKYYEVLLPRTEKGVDIERHYYENIINPFVIKHFRAQDCDYIGDTVKTSIPVILNRTNETDQELLNMMDYYEGLHRIVLLRILLPAKTQLIELMEKLRKEYHLELVKKTI